MNRAAAVLAVLAALITSAPAEPIDRGDVQAIDGDTIRARGAVVRLVGFDAPESATAPNVRASEPLQPARLSVCGNSFPAARWTFNKSLAPAVLAPKGRKLVICGRACGVLKARGDDVAAIIIGAGLAHPYACGARSCPPRTSWCQ